MGTAGLVTVALVVCACLPIDLLAQERAGGRPDHKAPPVRPPTVLAGSWGEGPRQFGLLREELPLGPSCFALDTVGQI